VLSGLAARYRQIVVDVAACYFKDVQPDWWEWLPAAIYQVIAVKNRSHNPKTGDTVLHSSLVIHQ